jgi:ankyrin repeat protein
MVIAARGNSEFCRQLLASGPNVQLKANNGKTACDIARDFNHEDVRLAGVS